MSVAVKARAFHAMHVKGEPVVLYNIWDAGGAKALAEAGACAIATGSYSMAAAQGYPDGEAMPLDFVTVIVARIVETVDVPVTADFEGGYAESPEALAVTAAQMFRTGVVGVNFEDRVVSGDGLYPIETQCRRIEALRVAADAAGVPVVINARTDLFLSEPDLKRHAARLEEAIDRASAYATAGADCFFVPGLADSALIEALSGRITLPLNVMVTDATPPIEQLAALGVARVSFGPRGYVAAMADLASQFRMVGRA